MVQRNDSIVRNVSKEEWRTKDIVECIFDDTDSECNLKPGTLADLAMVRNVVFCYQNCSSDRNFFLKFKAEGRGFAKCFRSLER